MADIKKTKPDSDAGPKADTSPVAKTKASAGSDKKPAPIIKPAPITKPARKPKTVKPIITPEEKEPPKVSDRVDAGTKTPAVPDPAPVETTKRGGFAPALIGGILAAFLGFLAARTEVLDPILPNALKSNATDQFVADLRQADAKQSESLAALQAEIAARKQPDLGPINTQLAALQADFAPVRAELDTQAARLHDLETHQKSLDSRLEHLEKQPMTDGASQSAIAAYDRELAELRDAIVAQRADVEQMIDEARATEAAARELEENAAIAARNARNQATSARLLGALDNGAGYASILAELVAAGVSVPDALNATAQSGVATLASLSGAFPAAARAALSASRADEGNGGGIGGFIQRQLGARSVAPREGDDADAILSRAEAAVTAGDLSKALIEIATLPKSARASMQDWVDIATTRLTALQAADQLAQSLNTN